MAITDVTQVKPYIATLPEWKQIPFGIEALIDIRPQKILDIGVTIGRWPFLIRQYCEEPGCMLERVQWRVRIEGVAPFANGPTPSDLFLYDTIFHAGEDSLLSILRKSWDLIIFEDVLDKWPKETAVRMLHAAQEAAEYVLVSGSLAFDAHSPGGHPSRWTTTDLLSRDPVRFAIFNERTGNDYGVFLLSATNPKMLRRSSSMADNFRWWYADDQGIENLESLSGPGSSLVQTDEIRRELPLLLEELNVRSLLDAPCGDFNWMQHVALDLDQYIGIDVVAELVDQNQRKFGCSNRAFLNLDITCDDLPRVDLIFCRDCLVHFSYEDVFRAIRRFKKSGSKYLLTTTFPRPQANAQITTGDWRPLNLQLYPFNFPLPLKIVNEKCTEECSTCGNRFANKSMALWDLATLP